MSRVILLSAERPMPLYEPELRRMSVSGGFTAETPGFSVQTHEYYRDAVDDLGLEMKPFSYELNLEATVEETQQLLRQAGYAQLYPRVRRDAIILHAIAHGIALPMVNDKLYEENEKTLF